MFCIFTRQNTFNCPSKSNGNPDLCLHLYQDINENVGFLNEKVHVKIDVLYTPFKCLYDVALAFVQHSTFICINGAYHLYNLNVCRINNPNIKVIEATQ